MNYRSMKKSLAILLTLVLLLGAASAEAEIRTIFVVGFDFATAEVILEDEDGFLWTCPFGESDWELGEEYQLVLSDEGAEIWEIE